MNERDRPTLTNEAEERGGGRGREGLDQLVGLSEEEKRPFFSLLGVAGKKREKGRRLLD